MKKKLIFVCSFVVVFIFSIGFIAPNHSVSSQKPDESERSFEQFSDNESLADLTIKIASLNNQKTRNKSASAEFNDSLKELAENRYELLRDLVEKNPVEVIRLALPDEILNKIPAENKRYFEKREEIKGELEVISECDDYEGRTDYFLKTENERIRIYSTNPLEEEFLTGSKIQVKGLRLNDAMVVESENFQKESANIEAVNSVLPNTFGEQKLLVLLVNFQNNQTQPYTVDQVNNLIFNDTNTSSVTSYYREASFGQTWFTGDTFGWLTLNMTDGCDYTRIASNAKSAAQNAGVNLSAYQRFMYIYPASGCGYSGLGTLGGNEAWINGTVTRQNISHELGHNLGLNHARFMDCGSAVLGNNCSIIEYGHILDTEGGGSGHFHAFHKERLGWLNYANSPPIVEVTQSGNYSIAPYSSNTGSLPKALKILRSVDVSGRKTWYYIEQRRNYGFDSGISGNWNLMNGVMVNLNQEQNSEENYMLDMTPETASRSDPALTVNRTYTDDEIGISFTPLSVTSSGATINVSFGSSTPAPCALANPTISVSPSATQWIGAGGAASYTVSVTNNNSGNCANTSFNVQPTLPVGWSAFDASPVLNINSGATASTTVQVFSSGSTSDGFYTVGFGASNYTAPSYSAFASVSCAVYSSLGVSASPDQSSYTRTQTASVTAYVKTNGSPMAGANVTFTMTKPDGKRVTASTVSAADGSAVFNYKFNKKQDPAGTYLVSVNASLNGVSGTGSTNFAVK